MIETLQHFFSVLGRPGLVLVIVSAFVTGCTNERPEFIGRTKAPEFRLNAVEARKQELNVLKDQRFTEAQLQNVGEILVALFGTPDNPRFPYAMTEEPEYVKEMINPEYLVIAAGAVSSDMHGQPRGLYREHCVHCHGVTGGGLGPTAATLNPYPRDFRMGKYKFKSTRIGKTPSRDDLRQILVNGIPGTAMPSFKLLNPPGEEPASPTAVSTSETQEVSKTADEPAEQSEQVDQIEVLVDYVIYLSIRGQVERALLNELPALKPDELLFEVQFADSEDDEELEIYEAGLDLLYELVDFEIGMWLDSLESKPRLAARPATLGPGSPERQELIDHGRDLFLGKANCHSCHGTTSLGDGQTDKYDQWTDDWISVVKDSKERLKEFESLGALPPRKLRPRNLRQGVFRGGQRPVDVFIRIKNGIDGTPMPAAPAGMSDEDLWAITEYVRQLHTEDHAGDSFKRVNERVVN